MNRKILIAAMGLSLAAVLACASESSAETARSAAPALPGPKGAARDDPGGILEGMSPEQLQGLIRRAVEARLRMERDQVSAEIRRGLLYDGDAIDAAVALLAETPTGLRTDNIDLIWRALARVDLRFAKAYGLFAAKCTNPEARGFTRENAAYLLPKTNPFLRRLFNHIAGPELDNRIAWLVDDLAQMLGKADMASILQDFGKHTAKEDPVIHFYETFLAAYDSEIRERRGVYYTPEPVVSYIVRSIDHLLKARFERPLGLADPNTLLLEV